MIELQQFIKEKVKCCRCFEPLRMAPSYAWMVCNFVADWPLPVFRINDSSPRQPLAIICESCITAELEPDYGIEISKDFFEVTYHDLKKLPVLPQLYSSPLIDDYGNLTCPACQRDMCLHHAGAVKGIVRAGIGDCRYCRSIYQINIETANAINVRRQIWSRKIGRWKEKNSV